jgi:phosphatidylinositol alpha 1,6-mannosyltransferase
VEGQATSRSDTPQPENSGRIPHCYVALGDSFTAGLEGEDDGARPDAPSWSDELANWLRRVNPSLEYHNLGVVQARSDAVVRDQLERAIELRPDLASVVCGGNDVLLSPRPDIDAYADALTHMFERLRTELDDPLLVTATTPDFSPYLGLRERSRERVADGIRRLNEATRRIADRHGVVCLDFAEHPEAGMRDRFAADGYHPSAESSRRAGGMAASMLERKCAIPMGAPDLEEI